jgi:hypothetical protein
MHKHPTNILNLLVNEGRRGGGLSLVNSILKRSFSLTSRIERRRPPREEYENNGMQTRKQTADPFDRY